MSQRVDLMARKDSIAPRFQSMVRFPPRLHGKEHAAGGTIVSLGDSGILNRSPRSLAKDRDSIGDR